MILLIPTQLTFGLMSAFMNAYVNSHIVTDILGNGNKKYVGYASAIASGTAALLTLPFGKLSQRISKVYLMVLGGVLFTVECILLLSFSNQRIGDWSFVVLVYAMYGAGRCVWEGTNKAALADFFPKKAPPAFATIVMASGASSGAGYLLVPVMHRDHFLAGCLVVASLSIFSSGAAFAIWKRDRASIVGR
eukprot:c16261_g1_i1.p1 GENE.c16261_g1_i1~~c16261_g1_i1.p1  ORF type:complete len:191 (-),score=35.54 c16261_g1_i1:116-688(-)